LSAGVESAPRSEPSTFRNSLWTRQLSHYPNTGPRSFYLGITVVATIILYYEFYLQGAVATKIITDPKLHMSFTFFVVISIIANGIGAFSSLVAGLADRWGRANLVTYGLFVTGALYLFALPHAPSKIWYTIIYAFVGFVEGIMLVATPALIRDFSPQVGRGFAMGFWTLGPVLGSLVVTEVSSNTLNSHPNWRFQFYVCGAVGLAVAIIAFIGLRELSPRLRDQLMVTMRDRALIEAKAAGLKLDDLSKGLWKQMLKLNIVGPAFAISLFLLLYYIAAGFAVVYFATVYGYSETKANSLANWYWITNALALIITGVLSDYFRVRKPFMVIGTIISLVGVALFAVAATDPTTTYYHLAVLFIIIASGGGMTYCAWMAAFTETVEKRNPAATATGLAVWGWIIRIVVTVALLVLTVVVSSTSTLVDTQSKYPAQVGVLSALDAKTSAALAKNPSDAAALSVALGEVAKQQATLHKSSDGDAQAAAVSAAVLKFAKPLGVLQSLDDPTAAALQKNPTDPVALPKALGQVAKAQGASASKVSEVEAATAKSLPELATASTIDAATLGQLSAGQTTATLIAKAQGEIASGLKVTPAEALTKLLALAVPATKANLTLITPYATSLQAASAAIPADQLALINKYGTVLKQAKAGVPAAELAKLQKAAKDTPNQWQHWWWICFAAQIVFLPFIFLLTGRWSSRRARLDEQEHEEMIAREMDSLGIAR
jgi:ACS family D-galactonate transporter-like MFS transporter